jgi:hypothetical protein
MAIARHRTDVQQNVVTNARGAGNSIKLTWQAIPHFASRRRAKILIDSFLSDNPSGTRLDYLWARTRHREVTDEAIVVTDQAAGTAGMKLVGGPSCRGGIARQPSGANYGDVVVGFMRRDSPGMAAGPRPDDRLGCDRTPSILAHASWSGHRLSYGTTGCRWDSGRSASQTGLATARWRSM